MRLRSYLSILLVVASTVHATIYVPPTLSELVDTSDHIGLAVIQKSEAYDVTDSEGVFPCGVIYEATWVDSLTSDTGTFRFTSQQILEVRGLFLLYLAKEAVPLRKSSTNSISEERAAKNGPRRLQCIQSIGLPKTNFRATKFINEEWVAETFKTGVWVEDPGFRKSDLDVVVIYPNELSIAGQTIPRERFLEEYFDESKHQVIRTAGYSLIVFKAVEWSQYCAKLVELAGRKKKTVNPSNTFCQRKTQWKAPGV